MRLLPGQRVILKYLKTKYQAELIRVDSNPYNRIALAIRVIESFNRRLLWRLCEYIVVALEFLLLSMKGYIDNKSIGIYQLKINMIWDFVDIKYRRIGRKLYPERKSNVWSTFKHRNSESALIALMKKPEFNFYINNTINWTKLKYFIEEYSRTIEVIDDFTYFYVFRNIVEW